MFANGVSHSGDKDQTASSITQPAESQEVFSVTQLIKPDEIVQAPSSKEGMFASVVSMPGNYTPTLLDEEAVRNYHVTHVQEDGTSKARLDNLQPWPNKSCELGGLGGGHSNDQLP